MEERSEWSERLAMYAMDMWEDRPDVKIFVSRRIDIDSVLVDNPLYVPVRCGAVFDKENPRAQQLYVHKGYKSKNEMTIGDRTYDHMVKEI